MADKEPAYYRLYDFSVLPHWFDLDTWTPEEGACLICNLDPERSDIEWPDFFSAISDVVIHQAHWLNHEGWQEAFLKIKSQSDERSDSEFLDLARLISERQLRRYWTIYQRASDKPETWDGRAGYKDLLSWAYMRGFEPKWIDWALDRGFIVMQVETPDEIDLPDELKNLERCKVGGYTDDNSKNDRLSIKERTNYLNMIGAMLELLLGKDATGKPNSIFHNQSAVINDITTTFEKVPGLSKRNLEEKFSKARRSITSET